MYKVFILDIILLKTFLSAVDTDYINVILKDGFSHLIVNQSEIFSVMNLRTVSKEGTCHIRIPKTILSKLAREGSLEITINDGIVETKLMGDKDTCYCTANFIKQDFPINDSKYKMNLLEKAFKNSQPIELAQFESLEKIMRTTKSILNVSDGVAMLTASLGRIYKEVDPSYKFAVTPFSYYLLKRCSDKIFSIDNYLVAQKDGLLIAVNKCKSFDNSEYTLFLEQKAALLCEIGLTDLKYFLSRVPSSGTVIQFSTQTREAHFSIGTITYTVPVAISNLKKAAGATETLQIPESVMREVLFNLDTSGAVFAKKRTFTQIRVKDLLIVF